MKGGSSIAAHALHLQGWRHILARGHYAKVSRCPTRMKLKWWFSVLLGVTYLAVFNLWRMVNPLWIVATGLAVSALLTTFLVIAARKRYFVNLWDELFHASVILDIV